MVLVSCLLVLTALAAISAASLWLTRSELWARGNERAALQARYSAEAGLFHAIAVIAPGWDFEALRAGRGGLSDPERPGPLPFAGGGWVAFPGPPFGYAVRLVAATPAADGSPRIRLESLATAVREARRAVRGFVGRAREGYAPAALVVASGELSFAGHAVGAPTDPGVVVDARTGGSRRPAALGAASTSALDLAHRAGRGASAALLGTRSSAVVRGLDLDALLDASGLLSQPAEALELGVGESSSPAALRVAPGDAASLVGPGVLLADGDLTIAGETRFAGVLLVRGRLRLVGAPCRVDGMVWAQSVDFGARCEIVFDARAIDAADRVFRLPRLPVLLAVADVEAG
jgi:hypothetical protein